MDDLRRDRIGIFHLDDALFAQYRHLRFSSFECGKEGWVRIEAVG